MRAFSVDKDLSSNCTIAWNHQEFEVDYKSLAEEIKIGQIILLALLLIVVTIICHKEWKRFICLLAVAILQVIIRSCFVLFRTNLEEIQRLLVCSWRLLATNVWAMIFDLKYHSNCRVWFVSRRLLFKTAARGRWKQRRIQCHQEIVRDLVNSFTWSLTSLCTRNMSTA